MTASAEGGGKFHFLPLLYRRRQDIYWVNPIHNYLHVPGKTGDCGAEVVYSYSVNHQLDPGRSMRILLKAVEKSRSPRNLYYLAREHTYKGDSKAAVPLFEEQVSKDGYGAQRADGYYLLARCYRALSRYTDARNVCLQAINLNANFRAAHILMSEMTGPGNSKRWKEMAVTASNKGLLFVRDAAPEPPKATQPLQPMSLYCSKGMGFFGDKAKKLWNFPSYRPDIHRNSPAWFFAMYNDEDYEVLRLHEGPTYFYWHGSDIARLEAHKDTWLLILKAAKGVHATFSTCRQEKLAALGIESLLRPLFFGFAYSGQLIKKYQHSRNPQLYTTMHPQREDEYGLPILIRIAQSLQNFGFHIYGTSAWSGFLPDNIHLHDWVEEAIFDRETDDFQGAIKLLPTKSISQTQIKALMRGQYSYSLSSYNGDVGAMIESISKLASLTEPCGFDESYLNDLEWLGRCQ